jgi:hypothetical protein
MVLPTAFLAGIGAAADTARATLENIPAKLEDDLKEMGVLYNAQNEKFNQSLKVAEANIANIERIASDFGIEAGIVNSVYAANGGDESKTREQLKNIIDTYGDQPIPTVPIAPTKSTTLPEQMQVDAAPKEAVSKNMFQDFAKLFRYYGPEQVLQEFAKKQNISVDRAQKILSGTFGDLIPEAQYKVKPSPEAMLAGMEKVEEVKTKDEFGGLTSLATSLSNLAKGEAGSQRFKDVKIGNANAYQFALQVPSLVEKAIRTNDTDALKIYAATIQTVNASIQDKPPVAKDLKPSDAVPTEYSMLPGLIKDLVEKTKDPTSGFNAPETVTKINELFTDLQVALGADKGSAAQTTLLKNLNSQYLGITGVAPESEATNFEEKVKGRVAVKVANGDTRPEEVLIAEAKSEELYGIIDLGDGIKGTLAPDAQGTLTVNMLQRRNESDKLVPFSVKQEKENNNTIKNSTTGFVRIATLRKLLAKDRNVLNIFGKIRMTLGDVSEITGLEKFSFFEGNEVQQAIQTSIEFFKQAKDDIFKDPRISDQDKALIERYIAIIDDDTVSNSRALAALLGLERQAASAMAFAIADNDRELDIIHLDEAGYLDLTKDSVAKQVFNKMFTSHGYSLKDLEEGKYTGQQLADAQVTAGNFMLLATNAVYGLSTDTDITYNRVNDKAFIEFGPVTN